MKRSMTTAVLFLACVTASAGASAPYAGQEAREIKALSAHDIAGLLAGQGAGMAKAAELNGYPGPAHVLEFANELSLSAAQRDSTERLMKSHKARAAKLGADVVEAELALDRLFTTRHAEPEAVERATARVGALQAALRAEHLNTHLLQTRLLLPDQVQRYQVLRGYAAAPAGAGSESGPHHRH